MRELSWAAAAVFATALGFAAPAHAQTQDQARAALSREVVQLLEVEEVFDETMRDLSPIVAQSMANELRLDARDTARLSEILAEEFHASSAEMARGVADVYARGLSEQQLRELVGFLQSPSGRAFADIQNTAQAALDQIGARVGEQVGLRAIARLQAEQAERLNK